MHLMLFLSNWKIIRKAILKTSDELMLTKKKNTSVRRRKQRWGFMDLCKKSLHLSLQHPDLFPSK